jgi:hypothetical protein
MKTNYTIPQHCFVNVLIVTMMAFTALITSSCDEFIKIDPPRTDLVRPTVFADDVTANAAMVDIYFQMSVSGFASGSTNSVSLMASYSADEQVDYTNNGIYPEFNNNELSVGNLNILSIWSTAFKAIYQANSVLEGIAQSSGISSSLKLQLEGEAKFIRAYSYFYMVNLFGDVPLLLTADYNANSQSGRSPSAEVYKQIIADLVDAKTLLPDGFAFSNNQRLRANKGAAAALLARTYLYTNDWAKAETEAGSVIDNSALYSLQTDLSKLMYKNNNEAILQFYNNYYPNDNLVFAQYGSTPNPGALRDEFVNYFEAGDLRLTHWVGTISSGSQTYYFCKKYFSDDVAAEYSTLMRLAEQYLIRAESRAQLGDINGAQSDIDVIRARAGLAATPASDKASLLLAIEQERKVELFTEHGHRWLDLKRTGRVDAVMAPVKGALWQTTDALYPIPLTQIQLDVAMAEQQNPGY